MISKNKYFYMTEIEINNKAIENTINGLAPIIEWGFSENNPDKQSEKKNINYLLEIIILILLCWSFIGIIISLIRHKNIYKSILLGPFILFTKN
jgi:hypothetical protein